MPPEAVKVTLQVDPPECALRSLPGPDYHALVRRRLAFHTVNQGDTIAWDVGGRAVRVTVMSTEPVGACRIDPEATNFDLQPVSAAATANTAHDTSTPHDPCLASLINMIREGFDHMEAFRRLGLPTAKSIVLHGPAGVGKRTMVQHASQQLNCRVFGLSLYELLEMKEEWHEAAFDTYNPLHLALSKAMELAPAILLLSDLDAIGKEDKLVEMLRKELARVPDTCKVCIIGAACHLQRLPGALQKTDIFQQHLAVPIPSREHRVQLLRAMLVSQPVIDMDDLVTQIGLRTSGYVARDLALVCRNAMFKAFRRHDMSPEDELVRGLAQLKLEQDVSRPSVTLDDFLYALEIHRPSQQMDVETVLPKRRWDDIGGYDKIKQRIRQCTLVPLLQPDVFRKLGIHAPSGLLLYGPSGCGKTALVQALATEAMMNVIAINGPQIFSKYLGDTEREIRRLFATAKRIAPCLVVIDEMDAIACKRGWNDSGEGGVNERVLSTLLNEMDGVEGRQGVIVIGCTNRPHQIDDAILRPGRLDQLIFVGMPTEQDRRAILDALKQQIQVDNDVDTGTLAQQTPDCTGADLHLLLREAATEALRENIQIPAIAQRHIDKLLPEICARASEQHQALAIFEQFQAKHRV